MHFDTWPTDIYYAYQCKTCGHVWHQRQHGGRRCEHCPAHRDKRQRARAAAYRFVCMVCLHAFTKDAGGRKRKYCPDCSVTRPDRKAAA